MRAKNIVRPILYFSDEMRYGLMSNMRRSWSQIGKRAVLPHQQAFANRYLFSVVAPLSGDSFHLLGIDEMDTEAEFVCHADEKRNIQTSTSLSCGTMRHAIAAND